MRYGFVTFSRPEDAYTAIDSSSGDSSLSTYDVSFGGRRAFCKTQYADLGMFACSSLFIFFLIKILFFLNRWNS